MDAEEEEKQSPGENQFQLDLSKVEWIRGKFGELGLVQRGKCDEGDQMVV